MNYQNAMAICRVYGPPDLFVTFICNNEWREIVDTLQYEPGKQPCDHSDLIMQIFHIKVNEFREYIREGSTFSPVRAVLYTTELQKCGLPHIHDGNIVLPATPAGSQTSRRHSSSPPQARMCSAKEKSVPGHVHFASTFAAAFCVRCRRDSKKKKTSTA